MCRALAEIMKPEMDEAFNNGFNNGFDNGFGNGVEDKGMKVFRNMMARGFSKEEAQVLAEISDELVEKAMKEN